MSLAVNEKLKVSPKITSVTVDENRHIVLKWKKVPGAEKYAVKRALASEGEFEHLTWVKKCEFIDEEAPEDTTCRYRITAWKKLEGKKTSTKNSAVMAAVISDIEPPQQVRAEASEKGVGISLSWKNTPGATGCIIGRRNDFFSQIIPVAKLRGESYTDEDIVPGQCYHYSLQCYISEEEKERQGNFSSQVSSIYLDCGRVLEIKTAIGRRVCVVLRLVAGADGYILERSDKKDGEYKEVARSTSGLSYRLEDKAPGSFRKYFYRCRAYKNIGDEIFVSSPSPVKEAKIKL